VQGESISNLNQQLLQLKSLYLKQPFPSLEQRRELLNHLLTRLIQSQHAFVVAADKDFNGRTVFDSQIGDILPTVNGLRYQIKHLAKWMRPDKRQSGIAVWPSKAWVQQVPKGVVGIIAPWNFPIQLALLPVFTALGAGNRVMLKLSEFTPHVNQEIKVLLADIKAHCVVIEGDHTIAAEFSNLTFDHLFFTGATNIGRMVMRSAASNLVPVTLELGGKSPVIVADDANIKHCAKSILLGKLTNAGQICVAPDYVLVTKKNKQPLIDALKEIYSSHYPKGQDDKNLSSIINEKQYVRLNEIMVDAHDKGAVIWPEYQQRSNQLLHENAPFKMGFHLIINPTDNMLALQKEIFGPILPIIEIESIEDAIQYVEQSHTPLASYVFTHSKMLKNRVSQSLRTGTLAINDTTLQVTVDDCPFGGVGYSGMGQYHGKEGFLTFSHGKSILVSGKIARARTSLLLKQSKLLINTLVSLFLK
jgi:coniferyl-aldehyde dehydrogenase